jgi:diketogulonate reductase-like aldo/keto reductase
VDVIDLYQIHWPNSYIPIKETMRAMEALVDAGLVKYIGVSNFSVSELRDAQAAMSKYPIVSNQVLYNLNSRSIEHDLLPHCQKHHVTVIAYTPLDDGRLATKSRFRRSRGMQILEQIAAQVQKTLAQVALNWCTSRPNVIAIPKSNSLARTEENCQGSGWRLSQAQIKLLDEAFG